jgi:hypothetical protein
LSTTLTRPAVEPGRTNGLRLDPISHRRRPALAVGSLALVMVCVAVFISVYQKAGDEASVLVITRSVAQGQTLTAADLRVARMSVSTGVASVPAAEASAVVGRRASEGLAPDTLLSVSDLVTSYSPPAGQAVVGIAARDGQLPASGVAAGETVDVVLTGLPGEQEAAAGTGGTGDAPSSDATTGTSGAQSGVAGTVLVADATVVQVSLSSASSGSGTTDVSLLMPLPLGPIVANASTAGEVALIVVGRGS